MQLSSFSQQKHTPFNQFDVHYLLRTNTQTREVLKHTVSHGACDVSATASDVGSGGAACFDFLDFTCVLNFQIDKLIDGPLSGCPQ